MPESLEANLRHIRQAITRSAERAGRDPGEVVLVAVTKTLPVERIREAVGLGLTRLGENLPALARSVNAAQHLRLRGLMTVAPMVADAEQVRPVFRGLRSLRDTTSQQLGMPLPVLSMGMTDDYPIAIEEGATMLRLGRALF